MFGYSCIIKAAHAKKNLPEDGQQLRPEYVGALTF
jgi:hypothetical protein